MSPQSISVIQNACHPTSNLHHLKCGHYVDLRRPRFPCQRNCMNTPQPSLVAKGKDPALFRGQCWLICGQCLRDEWSLNEAVEMQELFDLLWETDEYNVADVMEQMEMNQNLFEDFDIPGQFHQWIEMLKQQGRLAWGMDTDEVDEDEFVEDIADAFDASTRLADGAGGSSQTAQQRQNYPLRALKSKLVVPELEPLWQSRMQDKLCSMTLGGEKEQKAASEVLGAWQPRQEVDREMEEDSDVEDNVEMNDDEMEF